MKKARAQQTKPHSGLLSFGIVLLFLVLSTEVIFITYCFQQKQNIEKMNFTKRTPSAVSSSHNEQFEIKTTEPHPEITQSAESQHATNISPASKTKKIHYQGADISALTLVESSGIRFLDRDQQQKNLIKLFMDNGANCFRLRLFVDPNMKKNVCNDLEYTLALAKRIKSSGGDIFLDIQYSDHWCDPGQQAKPKRWEHLSFEALVDKVGSYSKTVIAAFKKNNCLPAIIQVGNEISPGMLWPDAQVTKTWNTPEQWNKLSQVLIAAIAGIMSPLTNEERPLIALHTTHACRWKPTDKFFSHMIKQKVDFDIIAQSYYPYLHGTMGDMRSVMHQAIEKFDKYYMIAETAYPCQSIPKVIEKASFKWYPEAMKYPIDFNGQKAFMEDLLDVTQNAPHKKCIGVFWWFPESMTIDYKIRKKHNVTFLYSPWNSGATSMFHFKSDGISTLTAHPNPCVAAFSEQDSSR